MSTISSGKLLKTLPGLLISAFFLWYTFKGISLAQFRALRLVSPIWIFGLVGFGIVSYTLRCVRWHRMMRSTGTSLLTCSRVFMTSLAANNILPFRIGDIMRMFTYAPDLNTTPSVIMSTILLEKLLDIFVLVSIFSLFLGPNASPHSRLLAHALMTFSVAGLAVLLLGARTLDAPLRRLFARLPRKPLIEKLEHWILLALECIRNIGLAGSLLLLVQSIIIWSCEGFQFYSAARILGVQSSPIGPWQAVSTANFAFLIPSSPGGIGPFEWATQTAMVSHGANPSQAALYALALHVWMLVVITGVGGAMFLGHRIHNTMRKPLLQEIENLPVRASLKG